MQASEGNLVVDDEPEAPKIAIATGESTSDGKPMDNDLCSISSASNILRKDSIVLGSVPSEIDKNGLGNPSEHSGESRNEKSVVLREDVTVSGQREDRNTITSLSDSLKVHV